MWRNSSHVDKVDTKLFQTLRIISGTVKSTPTIWLPALCNIAPPDLRRSRATAKLIDRCFVHGSSNLFDQLTCPPVRRLKSRYFIWDDIPCLENFNISDKWRERWDETSICNYELLADPTAKPGGFDLPRAAWTKLNRLRTGHGRCMSCMYKWGLAASPACDCGAIDQSMCHIVMSCPLRRFSGTLQELSDAVSSRSIDYLMCLDLSL